MDGSNCSSERPAEKGRKERRDSGVKIRLSEAERTSCTKGKGKEPARTESSGEEEEGGAGVCLRGSESSARVLTSRQPPGSRGLQRNNSC